MIIRLLVILSLCCIPLPTYAQANAFTLEGTATNDYRPALIQAVNQLSALLGVASEAIPHLRIVVNSNAQESQRTKDLPGGERILVLSEDLLAKKQRTDETMASVVAHEACHLWLIELAKSAGIQQTKTGYLPSYGHSQFNDWFDELTAVACEQGALAAKRREAEFSFIPLATYFTQQHPVYARMKEQIAAAIAAKKANSSSDQSGQTVLKLTTTDESFADFYRQSAYFAAFVQQLPLDLDTHRWFQMAQQSDPERIAVELGFASLAELELAFHQFIPW